ncbi:MAG: trypsin-like peptidase domain-containing protein [Rhodomicrobium sp.]
MGTEAQAGDTFLPLLAEAAGAGPGDSRDIPAADYDESLAFQPESLAEGAIDPFGAVKWAPDEASTDYRHIRPEDCDLKGTGALFSAAALELLISANSFEPVRNTRRIVFGLRGCHLDPGAGGPDGRFCQVERSALRIRDTRPDHKGLNCVIGVYNLDAKTLSGFIASTVPNRNYVLKYSRGGNSGNLLPCGCYRMNVGTHNGVHRGCLIQGEPITVLRSRHDALYDVRDIFDCNTVDWPWDNLHPAFRDTSNSSEFSSAGCQTVRGNYVDGAYAGEFAQFREALGLGVPGEDGGTGFSYVLLTGHEAVLAAKFSREGKSAYESLTRLRQGSRGQAVRRLQRAIGLLETGIFEAKTKKALAEFQRRNSHDVTADGVWGPAYGKAYGIPVFDDSAGDLKMAAFSIGPELDGLAKFGGADAEGKLESLYFELGRRSALAQSQPELLGEAVLPQPESMEPESLQAIVAAGQRAFERIERGVHELICGETADDEDDRAKIQSSLLAAAGLGPRAVVAALAQVLTGSLLIPAIIATTAAEILVTRLIKPAAANLGAALEPRVTEACGAWSRRLTASYAEAAQPSTLQPPMAGSAPAASSAPAAAGSLPGETQVIRPQPARAAGETMAEAFQQRRELKLIWRPHEDIGGYRTCTKVLPAGAVVTIGRHPDREIVLDDGRVSRLHARLEIKQDCIAVTDLDSKNGTFIGGKRITSADWLPGQILRIGIFQFSAELSGDNSSGTASFMGEAKEGAVSTSDPVGRVRTAASKGLAGAAELKAAVEGLLEKLANPKFAIGLSDLQDAMSSLKSARSFDYLAKLADSTLVRFPGATIVWTLYAQALIDTGQMQAGIQMLEASRRKPNLSLSERAEILGLLGRGNKQIYVDNVREKNAAATVKSQFKPYLQQAIDCYASVSAGDPNRPDFNHWHGINLVALLRLAEIDGQTVRNPSNRRFEQLARSIASALEPVAATTEDAYVFETLALAALAVGDFPKVKQYLSRFLASPKRDPFNLGGLIRQLEEVFRVQPDQTEPGRILAVLKAAEAGQEEGRFSLDGSTLAGFAKLASSKEHRELEESMVPGGGFVKLAELQKVVARAQAIAAVSDQKGTRLGTGFLVRGGDLNPRWGQDIYLVTNAHVMSEPPSPRTGLSPATARFELEGAGGMALLAESQAAWQSPFEEYDACIVRIIGNVGDVEPLRVADERLPMLVEDTQKGQEGLAVSVIGYPLGGSLQLSIFGSISGANGRLVDIGPKKPDALDPIYLHYRAPTLGGNSGSPVFETQTWTVVGLHHAGFDPNEGCLPRLGGRPGSNIANEGISIWSIRRAIARGW